MRFLCEKRCHTSQRQPMRPLGTCCLGGSAALTGCNKQKEVIVMMMARCNLSATALPFHSISPNRSLADCVVKCDANGGITASMSAHRMYQNQWQPPFLRNRNIPILSGPKWTSYRPVTIVSQGLDSYMARRRQCSFMGKSVFLLASKRPLASGSSGSIAH